MSGASGADAAAEAGPGGRAPQSLSSIGGGRQRCWTVDSLLRSYRPLPMDSLSSYIAINPRGGSDYGMLWSPTNPPLRGETPLTQCMETLQEGYLHAVCATARCTMGKPIRDQGIDWCIYHKSTEHTHDIEAEVRVQLKSTYQVGPDDGDSVPFLIDNKRLLRLTRTPVTISAILVGMVIPRETSDWIASTDTHMAIRHCCYWINLEGHPITGKNKTTINVPKSQVFDDVALCDMMSRIGKGGKA